MKALLLCPAERPAVAHLAEHGPLVTFPLLGRSVLEYWIEALAARGARHVIVLAADRPSYIRDVLGDGTRWGVKLEVVPAAREFTVEEVRARYRAGSADWLPENDIVMVDHLPGQPDRPLFESYAGWFAAVQAWLPHAANAARIGLRQIQPGIWVGLHSEIAPTARLYAPCWIGDHVRIAAHASIGPGAILDDRVVVEEGARVIDSVIAPETFVGQLVNVQRSVAHGSLLVNWANGSAVDVPDPFLLSSLRTRSGATHRPSLLGRSAAAVAMFATLPFALGVIALSLLRGETPWQLRLGVRCPRGQRRHGPDTFAYYELTGARNWLRRWPQFWSVLRGDLRWIGNRPLRPTEAFALTNDFERLWLAAPVGLISLADAHGCPEGVNDEACAHASFYAVHANRRLNSFILSRALLRAAMAWPIWWHRRKESPATLAQLVGKQEI